MVNKTTQSPLSTTSSSTTPIPGSPQPSTSSQRHHKARSVVVETLGATTSETKEGKKINHYLLKKIIGQGAFGTVHIGIDTSTNQEYVSLDIYKKGINVYIFIYLFRLGY